MTWTASNGTKTRSFPTWIAMMTFLTRHNGWTPN